MTNRTNELDEMTLASPVLASDGLSWRGSQHVYRIQKTK